MFTPAPMSILPAASLLCKSMLPPVAFSCAPAETSRVTPTLLSTILRSPDVVVIVPTVVVVGEGLRSVLVKLRAAMFSPPNLLISVPTPGTSVLILLILRHAKFCPDYSAVREQLLLRHLQTKRKPVIVPVIMEV